MNFFDEKIVFIFVKHPDEELVFRRVNKYQWHVEVETKNGVQNQYVVDNHKAQLWANQDDILESDYRKA